MLTLKPVVKAALNAQFTHERYSAALYYGLSLALEADNLVGFAKYLGERSKEESGHAHKFAEFIADRDARPIVEALQSPPVPAWSSTMDAGAACFLAALEHEHLVTDKINDLYRLAEEMDDPQTCEFLRPFVLEQVEEVKTLDEWMTRFQLAQGNGAAVLDLDRELR